MKIDDRLLQEIKEKNNIVDVIRSYIGLTGGGGRYKAVCPFHNEKTPSFSVNENIQLFKCFGCGMGGDVIKFVQEYERVDFVEAVEILGKRAGINMDNGEMSESQRRDLEKSRLIKQINQEALLEFERQLLNSKDAISYLKGRKLEQSTISDFRIGYANLYNELTKKLLEKYSKDVLIEAGLCVERNDNIVDKFRNRIVFPIIDRKGSIIGFGGRALSDYGPKYLNSPENPAFHKRENLYAIGIAKNNVKDNTMILAEGFMDVISLHQNGFKNSVASLGTAITKEQVKLIKNYAKKIVIAYDSDTAGVAATKRAIDIILGEGLEAYVIDLKGLKDPDEYAKAYGEKGLIQAVENARTALKFHLYMLYKETNLAIPNKRDEFIKKSQDVLKQYDENKWSNNVEIEDAIVTISKITKASIKSIGQGVYGKFFSYKKNDEKIEKRDKSQISVPKINEKKNLFDKELQLLSYINKKPQYLVDVVEEDFFFDESRIVYKKILIGEKLDLKTVEINSEEMFYTLLKSIKRATIEETIKKLELTLDEVERNNPGEAEQILLEISNLNRKLKY